MKSYTDINQSKKLEEFLSPESADMYYHYDFDFNELESIPTIKEEDDHFVLFPKDVRCWSLAALRSFLPCGVNINNTLHVFESHKTFDNDWVYVYKFENSEPLYTKASNEIDACFEMISKLNELNLL